MLRCRFHAKCIDPELGYIQITLEDVCFGVFFFDLESQEHLPYFTGNGIFLGMVRLNGVIIRLGLGYKHIFDVLLRQRRTALGPAALMHIGLQEGP